MKKFITNFLLFSSFSIVVLIVLIYVDTFRVFQDYDNFYDDTFLSINREMVTTRTYNKYRESEKFDSFILGSSRSQAYKCGKWAKHLEEGSKVFHYDASGEGVWGVSNKLRYIDELGDSIRNAIIILDAIWLNTIENREGHLLISPPCLSKESEIEYYFTFLKPLVNFKLLSAYIDYSIFRTHRDYMGYYIRRSKSPNTHDPMNCDIWYGYENDIKNDSVGYYQKLIKKGKFYKRPGKKKVVCEKTEKEVELLKVIKAVFDKHKTKYKLVISPMYNQIPLETEQVELLEEIFGKENVYNFSGKNEFTEHISNYYEDVHYRPPVANEIMRRIYSK